MKTKAILLVITLSLALCASAQRPDLVWAKAIIGDNDITPSSVETDAEGNIIVGGTFEGTADFDPGTGVFNMTSSENWNVFILKLNTQGQFLWAKQIKGSGYSRLECMAIDKKGDIFFTGYYGYTDIDFDPGAGVYNLKDEGGGDIYVAKIKADGLFQWAVSMGNEVSDHGASIAIDNEGNVLTTGYFQNTVDFDPGPGVFKLTSWGVDCFVLKLNTSGSFVWAKMIYGYATLEGETIKTDAANNIYISGNFNKYETDFDPGSGTFKMTPYKDGATFLLKLNKNGDFRWAIQPGGTSNSGNFGLKRPMTIDSKGNIFLAYSFWETEKFYPTDSKQSLTSYGEDDLFIEKIDSTGKLVWVKQIGGGQSENLFDIQSDPSDNIYITGLFNGDVDFDPGEKNYTMSAGGKWNQSIFVSKYDNNGIFVWAYNASKNGETWPYGTGIDLATDASENTIAVGTYKGSFDFNPGKSPVILTSPETIENCFILKLGGVTNAAKIVETKEDVSVFPNPFNKEITIYTNGFKANNRINLYSMYGHLMSSYDHLSGNTFEIDLSHLPKGMYVIEVINEHRKLMTKVIKQ